MITIKQEPQTIGLSENRNIYSFTSTGISVLYYEVKIYAGQPEFLVTTLRVNPKPTGDRNSADIDISSILKDYVGYKFKYNTHAQGIDTEPPHDYLNLYGYQNHSENALRYRVTIGSYYVNSAGEVVNYDWKYLFTKWLIKGKLDDISYGTWDYRKIFLTAETITDVNYPRVRWMNTFKQGEYKPLYKQSVEYIYIATNQTQFFHDLRVRAFYNDDTYEDFSPYRGGDYDLYRDEELAPFNGNVWIKRYDVSPSFLFTDGQLSKLKSYQIEMWSNTHPLYPTPVRLTDPIFYQYKGNLNCLRSNNYRKVWYQNRFGCFECQLMFLPNPTYSIEKTTMDINEWRVNTYNQFTNWNEQPDVDPSIRYENYVFNSAQKVLNIKGNMSYEMHTHDLTQEEMVVLSQIYDSTDIYVELADKFYLPTLLDNSPYEMRQRRFEVKEKGENIKTLTFKLIGNVNEDYIDFGEQYIAPIYGDLKVNGYSFYTTFGDGFMLNKRITHARFTEPLNDIHPDLQIRYKKTTEPDSAYILAASGELIYDTLDPYVGYLESGYVNFTIGGVGSGAMLEWDTSYHFAFTIDPSEPYQYVATWKTPSFGTLSMSSYTPDASDGSTISIDFGGTIPFHPLTSIDSLGPLLTPHTPGPEFIPSFIDPVDGIGTGFSTVDSPELSAISFSTMTDSDIMGESTYTLGLRLKMDSDDLNGTDWLFYTGSTLQHFGIFVNQNGYLGVKLFVDGSINDEYITQINVANNNDNYILVKRDNVNGIVLTINGVDFQTGITNTYVANSRPVYFMSGYNSNGNMTKTLAEVGNVITYNGNLDIDFDENNTRLKVGNEYTKRFDINNRNQIKFIIPNRTNNGLNDISLLDEKIGEVNVNNQTISNILINTFDQQSISNDFLFVRGYRQSGGGYNEMNWIPYSDGIALNLSGSLFTDNSILGVNSDFTDADNSFNVGSMIMTRKRTSYGNYTFRNEITSPSYGMIEFGLFYDESNYIKFQIDNQTIRVISSNKGDIYTVSHKLPQGFNTNDTTIDWSIQLMRYNIAQSVFGTIPLNNVPNHTMYPFWRTYSTSNNLFTNTQFKLLGFEYIANPNQQNEQRSFNDNTKKLYTLN